MIWMDEAKKWLGIHEQRNVSKLWGSIKQWLSMKYDPRETPWCGAFMGIVFKNSLPKEKIPENPWGARNWLAFGIKCELQDGAVGVFWRGRRSGWSGHVGLIVGIDEKRRLLKVLGGNQSDAVTYAWISMDRLLGCRWPVTGPKPSGKLTKFDSKGNTISTNEQ